MTKRKFDVDSGLESHNKSRRDLNTLNSNSTMTAHATAVQQAQTYLAAAQDLDKDELVHCLMMAQLKLDDREKENDKLKKYETMIHCVWSDLYWADKGGMEVSFKDVSQSCDYYENEEFVKKEVVCEDDDDEPRCDFCNRTHDEVMYEDKEEDAWDGDTGCCKKCQDDS